MKLKFSFFLIFLISNIYAVEVIISKDDLSFRTILTPKILEVKDAKTLPHNCLPLKIDDLKNNKYNTSKYIKKDQIICKDDVKKIEKKTVIFKFGNLEIETDGKILFENDEYIKIKKDNGKIEKIYKDGRVR